MLDTVTLNEMGMHNSMSIYTVTLAPYIALDDDSIDRKTIRKTEVIAGMKIGPRRISFK